MSKWPRATIPKIRAQSRSTESLTVGLKKNTRAVEQLTSTVASRLKNVSPSIWDLERDKTFKGPNLYRQGAQVFSYLSAR